MASKKASFSVFVGPLLVILGVPHAAALVLSTATLEPWWQSELNDLLRAAWGVGAGDRIADPSPGNGVQLATIDNATDPWVVSAGRDECSGCDFTVDLRCEGMRAGRYAACHRITDCLLTMYGMIQLARTAASSRPDAQICALTWTEPLGMDLRSFLGDVVGIKWHSLVDEKDSCASGLRYHAGYRTYLMGAQQSYLDQFGLDQNMVRSYSIDLNMNLNWMQRDFSAFVEKDGDFSPQFVIIHRRQAPGDPSSTRLFHDADLAKLKGSMSGTKLGKADLPLTVYYGNESVVDTVRMFTRAAEIIGYHGAAMANTLFSARRHCVHHITTFRDLQSQVHWRINEDVARMNKLGSFNVYDIPLIDLLNDNSVNVEDYEKAEDQDHFIKDLQWVPLSDYHISHLQVAVRHCLKNWVEGHW
ncbi:unnamed protein product [Prorocentrum cordatum]|uniref:Protein xylosyltransferase n=1 Tax=Prorocentrum cordatum TaxID=2364126 RepID=A0ABN9VGC4_9DINO|nr:unnamed protein product [Polarella glacialis]CAK0871228.1 unnamed protein product [Polarella glacialis]CAK0871229.1 unnamed protein product [Polarella glacialis]